MIPLSYKELKKRYIGKKFRYISKYGSPIENILCEDVSVVEHIEITNNKLFLIEDKDIMIISDKRNVYNLNEVEFYK